VSTGRGEARGFLDETGDDRRWRLAGDWSEEFSAVEFDRTSMIAIKIKTEA
jgi:hypothetical protein